MKWHRCDVQFFLLQCTKLPNSNFLTLLSPPMSVTPLPLFIYFFFLLSTLHFWQLNCHNILCFFSSSFGKPQFFLFFSSLHFWQLNCHNFFFLSGFGKPQFFPFFFPYIFSNLIVIIIFFLFPTILATLLS